MEVVSHEPPPEEAGGGGEWSPGGGEHLEVALTHCCGLMSPGYGHDLRAGWRVPSTTQLHSGICSALDSHVAVYATSHRGQFREPK